MQALDAALCLHLIILLVYLSLVFYEAMKESHSLLVPACQHNCDDSVVKPRATDFDQNSLPIRQAL